MVTGDCCLRQLLQSLHMTVTSSTGCPHAFPRSGSRADTCQHSRHDAPKQQLLASGLLTSMKRCPMTSSDCGTAVLMAPGCRSTTCRQQQVCTAAVAVQRASVLLQGLSGVCSRACLSLQGLCAGPPPADMQGSTGGHPPCKGLHQAGQGDAVM